MSDALSEHTAPPGAQGLQPSATAVQQQAPLWTLPTPLGRISREPISPTRGNSSSDVKSLSRCLDVKSTMNSSALS